jgi:hypothetical protein
LGLPRLTVFLEDEEKPATAIVEKWSDTYGRRLRTNLLYEVDNWRRLSLISKYFIF